MIDGDLGSVKQKLKTWEYYFSKCHQRKPLKADIDAAPEDIRASYKLYSRLKHKAVTSPPCTDDKSETKENVENVWGAQVSIKALESQQTRVEFTANGDLKTVNIVDVCDEKPVEKWTEKLTKRLTCQNKTPVSKSRRNSNLMKHRTSTSVSETDTADNYSTSYLTQSTKPITPAVTRRPRVRTFPKGWKSVLDGDSPAADKRNSFDDESPVSCAKSSSHEGDSHESHLPRISYDCNLDKSSRPQNPNFFSKTPVKSTDTDLMEARCSDTHNKHNAETIKSHKPSTSSIPLNIPSPAVTTSVPIRPSQTAHYSQNRPVMSVPVFKKAATDLAQLPREVEEEDESVKRVAKIVTKVRNQRNKPPLISRTTKRVVKSKNKNSLKKAGVTDAVVSNHQKTGATGEMPPSKTQSSDPYSFDIPADEELIAAPKRKRVSRVKKESAASEGDSENIDQNQKDTDADPPKVKRSRKRKTSENGDDIEKTTQQMAAKKTKLSSGTVVNTIRPSMTRNVNDNYVKLNLRKKSYARGKGGLKGAAYKRQQWKTKMSAKRGTACYKCGEEGHWANKCTGSGRQKQDKEPEVEFNEDTDGFLVDKPADVYLDDLMLGAYSGEKEQKSELYSLQSCPPLFDEEISQSDSRRELLTTLSKVFKFKSFRPGQLETVERIVRGKSTLVMLSTGAGKSLCYQLPAYLYTKNSNSIAVIISPLVSLMEDQITDLPKGVVGVCLHTNQTETMRTKCMNAVLEGGVQFLLCSPEFMCSTSHANIEFFNKIPPISFACIDEAHCLSEWSHNFRPSYLRVCKILRVRFGVTCFLGLTATATQETVTNIAKHLNLSDCETDCVKGTILPPNLNLSVSKDCYKEQALLELIQSKRFKDCQSIIIYCTRREQTDRLATVIRTVLSNDKDPSSDKIAESYHAGLSAAQRRRIQKHFMTGKLRIVVATVAFGMGLDKSDVRAVIHYTLPKGFESYVQEIGRAGRDGLPAECHVFLEPEGSDVSELEKHTYADSVDQSSIRKLLSMIYKPCKCQMLADTVNCGEKSDSNVRICPGHERAVQIQKAVEKLNITEQGIATLIFYLELHDPDWLENMSNVYSMCTIKCYDGLQELHSAAKKCIPLGVAMAMKKRNSAKVEVKGLNFNIMDVSSLLNKPSGYIKKDLKQLQFNQSAEGKWRRTGIVVEFNDLAMRVRTPGNLSDDQLDEILLFLKQRVAAQEYKEVTRLHYFYHILNKLAFKDYFMISEEADKSRSDSLKQSIVEYFSSDNPTENYTVPEKTGQLNDIGFIGSQVSSFIGMHSNEHDFTGRDVAKILFGIPSPNFPPNVWGRVRRFWRSLLGCDFNTVVRIATEHLVKIS